MSITFSFRLFVFQYFFILISIFNYSSPLEDILQASLSRGIQEYNYYNYCRRFNRSLIIVDKTYI